MNLQIIITISLIWSIVGGLISALVVFSDAWGCNGSLHDNMNKKRKLLVGLVSGPFMLVVMIYSILWGLLE